METPEGILLALRPAGLGVRLLAWGVDWLIRLSFIFVTALGAGLFGGIGLGFWVILLFLLEWFYPVIFELTPSGSTPGKRMFGLRVVMDNGLPITAAASIARNVLRAADFLPFAYGFAIVSMLVRRDFKRLGDIAASTLVVHRRRVSPRISLEGIPPFTPAQPLPAEGQAAIVALAARAPSLTAERLDELAAFAAAVSGNAAARGPDVTTRVLGVAKWVLGQRS